MLNRHHIKLQRMRLMLIEHGVLQGYIPYPILAAGGGPCSGSTKASVRKRSVRREISGGNTRVLLLACNKERGLIPKYLNNQASDTFLGYRMSEALMEGITIIFFSVYIYSMLVRGNQARVIYLQ